MGIFLDEEISKENPFREADKKELQARVIELLLEFGECAIEKVELYGKTIYVYDYDNLEKDKDDYILAYNRYENDTWEASYMNIQLDKFTGVRARAIGSKIGWKQHYIAMAVSRVLCECYSSGNYIVVGDIGTNTIYRCLAYIGKKYGFDLVEKFVACRTNLEIMQAKECCDKTFWGVREYKYYSYRYMHMEFEEWSRYMEAAFSDDIKQAEKTGEIIYCGSSVYLMSLFLKMVCERKLSLRCTPQENKDEILSQLKAFFEKYFIDAVLLDLKYDISDIMDVSEYEELRKYQSFYERVSRFSYYKTIADRVIFFKTVKNYLETLERRDTDEILKEFRGMMDEMIPSENEVKNFQEGNPQREAWRIYYILQQCNDQKDRKKEILESIMKIAEDEDDISSKLFIDSNLRDLDRVKATKAPLTNELKLILQDVFSKHRRDSYTAITVGRDNNESAEKEAIIKLLNMAEELYENSDILMTSKLFYFLLENAFSKEGKSMIDKIEFYLHDISDCVQKKIFLHVLENQELCVDFGF